MEHVLRFFSALNGEQPRNRDAEVAQDDDLLGLQLRYALAGTGARAARHLRGVQMDPTTMFVTSIPDRGGAGNMFSMRGNSSESFLMQLGPGGLASTLHEAMVQNAMGTAMQVMMEQIAETVVERSMQEMQPNVLPANESARDALPRVVVTKEDLMDSTNSKCSVCLEEYQAGIKATRMFCGHLFCTNCIREWLRTANSCPVCRFELPTDCEDYEAGRTERMRERVARFKEGELRSLRVPELRRVMVSLGVSYQGCVEKAELLTRLGATPGVEVLPDRKDIRYEDADLTSLELPLLRSLIERHRIPPLGMSPSASSTDMSADDEAVAERAEALQRFAAAGMMCEVKAAEVPSEEDGKECSQGSGRKEDDEKSGKDEGHPQDAAETSPGREDSPPPLPPPPPASSPNTPPPRGLREESSGSTTQPRSSRSSDAGAATPVAVASSEPQHRSIAAHEEPSGVVEGTPRRTASRNSVASRPAVPAPSVARPRVGSKKSRGSATQQ